MKIICPECKPWIQWIGEPRPICSLCSGTQAVEAIDAVKYLMANMKQDERAEVMGGFGEFCSDCGSEYLPCYCERDD